MYAKPSKEWVIPPRPRPGRKLKKDDIPVTAEEDDEEVKKIQNRAAQRAFRERKQSQLAELQARVEQYERGEITRNVALQAAAKRLKEENEALKKENAELKQMMETSVCHSCSSKRKYLKRSAENAADDVGNETSRGRPVRANPSKRMRSARAPSTVSSVTSHDSSFVTSEAGSSLIPSSSLSSTSTSSAPVLSDTPVGTLSSGASKPDSGAPQGIRLRDAAEEINFGGFEIVDCGFCDQDTPCVCRDAAAALAAAGSGMSRRAGDAASQNSSSLSRKTSEPQMVNNSAPNPILDHLPPYAPPVPLRRLSKGRTSTSLATERWITNPNPVSSLNCSSVRGSGRHKDDGDDACTGDPANCPACADDPANQAFCAALGDAYSGGEEEIASSATATPPPLMSCLANSKHRNGSRSVHFLDEQDDVDGTIVSHAVEPFSRLSVPSLCCGDPKLCGGACDAASNGDDRMPLVPLPSCSSMGSDIPISSREGKGVQEAASSKTETQRSERGKEKEMIPCNAAWAQLSSHPNIAFADLSLLADVVARRDHIHVASSSPPHQSPASATADPPCGMPLATTPVQCPTSLSQHDRGHDEGRTLVPQDHLILNGLGHRRRVRQVRNDGVQDALALLDGVRTLT